MKEAVNKKPDKTGEIQEIRNPDGTIKKGKSLNLKGRPKGAKNLNTKLKDLLQNLAPSSEKTYEDLLIDRILVEAIQNGNSKVLIHLWDQLCGRPSQRIDMTSNGETVLQGVVVLPSKVPKLEKTKKKKKDD